MPLLFLNLILLFMPSRDCPRQAKYRRAAEALRALLAAHEAAASGLSLADRNLLRSRIQAPPRTAPHRPTPSHAVPLRSAPSHSVPRRPTLSHAVPLLPTPSHAVSRRLTPSHALVPALARPRPALPRSPTPSHSILRLWVCAARGFGCESYQD